MNDRIRQKNKPIYKAFESGLGSGKFPNRVLTRDVSVFNYESAYITDLY
jgi:hypothetical protein